MVHMEDKELPIYIEAFGKKGKITRIEPRTRCTRCYYIKWDDGEVGIYRGASTRPYWIRHIFKHE